MTLRLSHRRLGTASAATPARIRCTVQRGYTLAELMIVVAMVGVLATLAVYGVRKYVLAAKSGEAMSMLTAIKAAEENYRDETFVYLGTADYDAWHPINKPGAFKTDWNADNGAASAVIRGLGVTTTNPVYYSYGVVAGRAGDKIPAPPTSKTNFNFPGSATEPFYVAIAKGDLDGDGVFSYVLSHSLSAEVYIEKQGD